MRISSDIQDTIARYVLERDKKERDERVESGRLTASMLGQPLQWQILKMVGVPQTEKDEYTLRKFQRGRDVEDWLIQTIGATDSQKLAEYRGVTGKIDGMYDGIPLEVKSVANAKFKWVKNRKTPDQAHVLQGALYALSEGTEEFALCYVASDDYRTMTFICTLTGQLKEVVDGCIDKVYAQVKARKVPAFEPIESWQANPKYNNYPEWSELTEGQIEAKLQNEYPDSFKILLSGKTIKEVAGVPK